MKRMVWFFARIFTLCLLSLTHLALAQCSAEDDGAWPSNNGGPNSFWQMDVLVNDNLFRTYYATIGANTSTAYTDCNCSYHGAAYMYSDDYIFNFSTTGGSQCYLTWEFTGPFQALGTCSSGPCSSGWQQQQMFEGATYGFHDEYAP
jgi:hypothetical protein